MFFIRAAFWISLAVFFIPLDDNASVDNSVSPITAMSAAKETVSDLRGFCERNTDVCEVTGAVSKTFEMKARKGAKMIYDYLDDEGATSQPHHDPIAMIVENDL